MNSIAIGWKKQAPNAVQILNKKTHSQKKPTRKIAPPKQQQQIAKTIEQHIPKVLRPNKLLEDNQPYAPLETSIFSAKPANRSASVIPINWDRQLCTTRGVVVTFIIIFILIIVAGASVGIVFAAINSKNSSGSGSNNTNQNLFTTISSGVLTSSVSIGSQTGPPCSSYTTINDPSRNYNRTGPSASCDNGPLFNTNSGGAWIRFVGSGGTIIAMSPPGIQQCGSFLPGWYNDTLPTPINPVINGTICFETNADECGVPTDTTVVYCSGNFYVYFLPPVPICNGRYCTA